MSEFNMKRIRSLCPFGLAIFGTMRERMNKKPKEFFIALAQSKFVDARKKDSTYHTIFYDAKKGTIMAYPGRFQPQKPILYKVKQ